MLRIIASGVIVGLIISNIIQTAHNSSIEKQLTMYKEANQLNEESVTLLLEQQARDAATILDAADMLNECADRIEQDAVITQLPL